MQQLFAFGTRNISCSLRKMLIKSIFFVDAIRAIVDVAFIDEVKFTCQLFRST